MKNRIQRLLNFQNVALIVFSTISFITLLFILFHNLGNNAIADWDEARHGINAYEMLRSNNWIISTYQYEPDLWNLKPPFSYYLIALFNFTKQNPTFEGYDCYFVKSKSEDPYPLENIKEGVWEQCDVLCAELNGDYKCLNGGIEGFRNNKKSILFIEKSLFENHQNELSQYEVYEYINYKILIN